MYAALKQTTDKFDKEKERRFWKEKGIDVKSKKKKKVYLDSLWTDPEKSEESVVQTLTLVPSNPLHESTGDGDVQLRQQKRILKNLSRGFRDSLSSLSEIQRSTTGLGPSTTLQSGN